MFISTGCGASAERKVCSTRGGGVVFMGLMAARVRSVRFEAAKRRRTGTGWCTDGLLLAEFREEMRRFRESLSFPKFAKRFGSVVCRRNFVSRKASPRDCRVSPHHLAAGSQTVGFPPNVNPTSDDSTHRHHPGGKESFGRRRGSKSAPLSLGTRGNQSGGANGRELERCVIHPFNHRISQRIAWWRKYSEIL